MSQAETTLSARSPAWPLDGRAGPRSRGIVLHPGRDSSGPAFLRRRTHAGPVTLAALVTAACAKVPGPPTPVPDLQPPSPVSINLEDGPPPLTTPQPLAPRLTWTPGFPAEGTLVLLTVEPISKGLPVFEVSARAGDVDLALTALWGGDYLGLVAAPRSVDEVPVELTVTLIDGTRISQKLALRITRREFPSTRLRVASRFTSPDRATLERIRKETQLVRSTLRRATPVPLWQGQFILPLEGATTSPYGQRRLFNNELRSQHTGLDIDGDTGDPVRASNSGRVVLSRDLFFNGQAVFIDHGLGFYTGYFHLSKLEVSEGQWVEKGEVVGLVGATGRVTGPHLHWALYVLGVPLDPLSLFEIDFARLASRLAAQRGGIPERP
jgi:murein DD-endopeptidase MepM/ murein hydrolase activator NlpD